MTVIIEDIAEEHAEEAAFLWLLRASAVSAPNYDLADLAELDGRIDAHFEGLRVAGDAGWAAVKAGLEHKEAGEVFAAAVLALGSGDGERLESAITVAETVPETVRGLISALGWVERKALRGTVRDLLTSGSPFRRSLGIAACAIHRADPGAALAAGVADPIRPSGAVAARRRHVEAGRSAAGDHTRVWRRRRGLPVLGRLGRGDDQGRRSGPQAKGLRAAGVAYAARAFEVALRAMDPTAAVEWLKAIGKRAELRRLLIIGGGIVGNPVSVPWLIRQMSDPEHARVAGEAVAMITGVDFAGENLEGDWPEGFEAGPSEDPEDEDVAMDADEDLPWPQPAAVDAWWKANKGRFRPGQRYLLGVPIAPQPLRQVLHTGTQRQRCSAAMEIALSAPDAPLFETRAPGKRQQALLAGG